QPPRHASQCNRRPNSNGSPCQRTSVFCVMIPRPPSVRARLAPAGRTLRSLIRAFHAVFLGFLLAPTRPTKPHMPPVHHHRRQLRRPPLGLALLSHLLEPFLGLHFGFASQALHQRMNDRVVHFTTPLARQLRRIRIRTGQRRREAQPLLHRRTHLLMSLQPPPFPNGATPMPIPRILSLPNHQFSGADDGAQVHRLLSPMMHLSAAE